MELNRKWSSSWAHTIWMVNLKDIFLMKWTAVEIALKWKLYFTRPNNVHTGLFLNIVQHLQHFKEGIDQGTWNSRFKHWWVEQFVGIAYSFQFPFHRKWYRFRYSDRNSYFCFQKQIFQQISKLVKVSVFSFSEESR